MFVRVPTNVPIDSLLNFLNRPSQLLKMILCKILQRYAIYTAYPKFPLNQETKILDYVWNIFKDLQIVCIFFFCNLYPA